MYYDFLGCFENINFHVKNDVVTFCTTFGKFWATLFSASSHTVFELLSLANLVAQLTR